MKRTLEITAPDKKRHKDAIYDLFGKAFGGYWSMVDYCRRSYFEHSHYDWRTSRIGLIGGKLVTHFGVWDLAMRIGRSNVRCAGVGAVMTDGGHRMQGYMAETAHACLEAMGQAGYDMSLLFGRNDLYHKYGYVRAWARTTYTVEAREFPALGPAGRLIRFVPGGHDELDRLYNREYAGYTCTAVRPTYQRCPRPDRWRGYLWTDPKHRPAGYVIAQADKGELMLVENAGELESVLVAIGILARRWSCQKVRFDSAPYGHPLARWARRGDCQAEARYVRSGGAMIRNVNLRSTLDKISGELSGRLSGSHLAGWRGSLLVSDPWQKAVLAIGRSTVRVADSSAGRPTAAIRGGAEIAQLIIGTDNPGEIIDSARTRLAGDAAALIEVLFPAQHPVLGAWDFF